MHDEDEVEYLIQDMHQGIYGGHFVAPMTAHRILMVGGLLLHYGEHWLVRSCEAFHKLSNSFPWPPAVAYIMQWDLDVMGRPT